MIDAGRDATIPDSAAPGASLAYLVSRVREEADAAARASSIEATLAHLFLATSYAKRFGEYCGRRTNFKAKSWVEDQRIW